MNLPMMVKMVTWEVVIIIDSTMMTSSSLSSSSKKRHVNENIKN
jgi:hypothetical protein